MPRKPLEVGEYGTINKRQFDKKWRARTRFRDLDGRTRQVEAWGKSGEAAAAALRKEIRERQKRTGDKITSTTRVEKLGEFWLRTKVDPSPDLAINSKQRYRYVVEKYVTPGLGGLLLREVSPAGLNRFVQGVQADVGQATARLARRCLVGMFGVAVLENALTANPARDVETVKATSSGEVRALTVVEVRELRGVLATDATATDQHLGDVVDVMLATGCRIGEALALRWSDVDFGDDDRPATVVLTGTNVRVKGSGIVRQDTTKGKKVSTLLLPAFAVRMLEKRITTVPAGAFGLVFPGPSENLRAVDVVERQWRDFRGRHPEWSWITPHTFRKSVGTLLEAEAGLAAAAAQLAHSKVAITARHYVATPDHAPDHRAILDAWSD